MPAISYAPFDGDGVSVVPHRPSLDNLGGNGKVDDQAYPPSSEEPSADEHNRFAELLALIGGIIPCLAVTVDFAGGTPIVAGFWAANSTLSSGDITLTDNGTGDTTIGWPASKLPPLTLGPMVTPHHNAAAQAAALLDEASREVRVRTNASLVATDMGFTLLLY